MNKTRALLLSVLVGVLATLLANSYVSGREANLLSMSTPVQVIVAARDIPEGTRLEAGLLDTVEVPKKYVQPDALKNVADAQDRVVAVPILRGTQILGSMLSLTQHIGLAKKIPKGKYAFSVNVNNSSSIAGLIEPGDYVDAMVTVEVEKPREEDSGTPLREIPRGQTEIMTKKVLGKVLVLAVDQRSYRSRIGGLAQESDGSSLGNRFIASVSTRDVGGGDAGASTVTLAVAQEQVLKLTLAQEIGAISLALISPWSQEAVSDADGVNTKEISTSELLGIKQPVVRSGFEIYRGGERERF